MSKKYLFGFVCDPLDTFNREAETSLFLMREIFARGHAIFVCEPKDLFLRQNEVLAVVKQIELTNHPHCFYRIVKQFDLNLAKLDCLFLRKDPPFDLKYLFHLWLLSKLEGKVLMINSPSGILRHNEKLSALCFPFAPKTWVGANIGALLSWAKKFQEGIVVKPLNNSGGRDIFWLKRSKIQNPKSKKMLRRLTQNETQPVIAQEFLPAVKRGDKRIMLWNGRILGAFVRRPTQKGEFRANLHLGGKFERCTLTPQEKKIAQRVAIWAKREGLYFAGLDMVGSYLTEINVTSPMGIRELNVLYDMKIEEKIINSILNNAKTPSTRILAKTI